MSLQTKSSGSHELDEYPQLLQLHFWLGFFHLLSLDDLIVIVKLLLVARLKVALLRQIALQHQTTLQVQVILVKLTF